VTPHAGAGLYPTEGEFADELREFLNSDRASYRHITIIDADSGGVATLELDFPDGYTGWPVYLTGVSWFDDGHLAVPAMRIGELVPDLAASQREGTPLAGFLVDGVSVFDDSGNHVTHLPIKRRAARQRPAGRQPDVEAHRPGP